MPISPELRKALAENTARTEATARVLDEVLLERKLQFNKWGEQNHEPFAWLAILGEEVGEANMAALEAHFTGYEKSGDLHPFRAELIQVAAVAVAMIECLDRHAAAREEASS